MDSLGLSFCIDENSIGWSKSAYMLRKLRTQSSRSGKQIKNFRGPSIKLLGYGLKDIGCDSGYM